MSFSHRLLAARADSSAEDTGPLLEHLDALRSVFEGQAVQEAGGRSAKE